MPQTTQGKVRVIIENVQPIVDGGLYPAKRTVGERVDVSATIFGDGHDHIRAMVRHKQEGEAIWKEVELQNLGNDEWHAFFVVHETGKFLFTVEAWIDHFETWYAGFKKKVDAKVDVKLELMEGANFLIEVGAGNESLEAKAKVLNDTAHYRDAINLVMGDDFKKIVHDHPLKRHVTELETLAEVIVESKKALFSSWYEFFPRSSSLTAERHGMFKDCIRLLPRVAAMGFDVLYFPPIHPIGKKNRKGKNNNVRAAAGEPGSPWAIGSDEGGHKSILPALGTLDDYVKLIEEANKLGIQIALDLAFQCAPDHPYVKEHPEWFYQRPDGSIQYAENPPKKYQDIYPFNFESHDWKGLWEELKSVILFWVKQGVTIFRVDNPHTKPIPFWHWVIGEVHKDYPDVIFLAEAFTRPKIMASLAKVGVTQSYTYFTWRVTKSEIIAYMNELVHSPSRNYFRPNFWPNTPDILPFHMQHQGENIFIIRFVLAATLSASYGIYGPTFEFYENMPIENREEYFNSEKFEIKHYDWKRTNRMTDIIAMVNKIRRENEALHSTWNIQFCGLENPNLLAYVKTTHDLRNIILVVVTLDPQGEQSGYVQLPKEILKGVDKVNVKLHDLITDERYTWTQEWNFVQLTPHKMPFHLFKVDIHESNM